MRIPAIAFVGLLVLSLAAGCAPQTTPAAPQPAPMASQPAPMASQPAPMAAQPAPMAAQRAPAYVPKETDKSGGGSGY